MAVLYYANLDVWQKSMDLAVSVYKDVKVLPKEELFSLSNQMRRAVTSIPSNIAEGNQRGSIKEYLHFLYIAMGSLGELETQIILCKRLEYLSGEATNQLLAQCKEVGRMLNGLIKNLQIKLEGSKEKKYC